MMYKRKIAGIIFFCTWILLFLLKGQRALAEEIEQLPEGEILIVYSDDSTTVVRDKVMLLVENLTYQNYRVTYARASECTDSLGDFESVILYNVERYSEEFILNLYEREKNRQPFLIMGNKFLREYYNYTRRETQYIDADTQVARLEYSFSSSCVKESLVKESEILFMKNPVETYGSVEAAGTEGYYIGRSGVVYHIPLTDLDNPLVCATAFREIAGFVWNKSYGQYIYAQYIVLNQVYPFQNPEKLLEVVKDLIELKLPFIITVMPIYEHGDYPAMQEFCEVLKYAQANGGMIMIHTPLNQMPEFDAVEINKALTTAVSHYIEQGVYPMGLQIPRSWMFRQDTLDVMNGYGTILVSGEEDRLVYSDVNANSNAEYLAKHQWIAPAVELDTEGTSYLTNYSSAVFLDVTEDEDVTDKRIKACMESEVPLKNIWDANHYIETNADKITYQNGYLYVNGVRINLTYKSAEESEEEFEYKRNILERVSADLTGQNRKLIIAVIVVSVLFVGFIISARRQNRNRFFINEYDNPWDDMDDEQLAEQLEKQLQEQLEKPLLIKDVDDYDITNVSEDDDYDLRI